MVSGGAGLTGFSLRKALAAGAVPHQTVKQPAPAQFPLDPPRQKRINPGVARPYLAMTHTPLALIARPQRRFLFLGWAGAAAVQHGYAAQVPVMLGLANLPGR